jgi:hypothetical protein
MLVSLRPKDEYEHQPEAGLTEVAMQGQVANLPLQVACPVFELKEPAHPLRSQDWGVPQVLLVGLHLHVANFPLHRAMPSESKVPAQPLRSQDCWAPQVLLVGVQRQVA